MPGAGRADHLFKIYQPVESGGDAVAADVLKGTAWGEVEGLTNTTRGDLTDVLEYRIKFPVWHPELAPEVAHKRYLVDQQNDRRYGVLSAVEPNGRRAGLVILAEAQV